MNLEYKTKVLRDLVLFVNDLTCYRHLEEYKAVRDEWDVLTNWNIEPPESGLWIEEVLREPEVRYGDLSGLDEALIQYWKARNGRSVKCAKK